MKRLALAFAASLLTTPALAADVGGSGTQPYGCTVVGNSSMNLVSTGPNQLIATGPGSIYQNSDTDYTLSAVTVSGPDANVQSTISAIGGTLSVASTDVGNAIQQINGELSENLTYTVSVSSSDGILTSGNYSAYATLTCTAAQ